MKWQCLAVHQCRAVTAIPRASADADIFRRALTLLCRAGYPALALLQQAQQRQGHQQQHPPQAVSTAPGAFRLYGQPLLGAQDQLGQKRKAGEPGGADLPEVGCWLATLIAPHLLSPR